MRFLVFGAGAVGAWIGANLVMARQSVTFVGRPDFVATLREQGLRVVLPSGETWRLCDLEAGTALAEVLGRASAPFDAVILCMKSFDLPQAIAELRACETLIGRARLVTFQNGIGSEAALAEAFGTSRLVAATLTSPVSLDGPAAVRLERFGGGVGLAALSSSQDWLAIARAMVGAPLLRLRTYDDWQAMKWSKLLLNLMGNATSALLGLPPAAIYRDRRLFAIEMRALREALAVMAAHAPPIRVVNLPGYPVRALALAVNYLPAPLLQPILARLVARGRGDKWPSLYYDVAKRTGRSEVMALNGAVADAGQRLSVPTPINAVLTEMVMRAVQAGSALTREDLIRACLGDWSTI
jgi:2-dehydropantoate 2-reductase